MLRYLVLTLLLVNLAFLAWSQGWLKAVVDVQLDAQHEPQRLQQQLHADRITVVTPPLPARPSGDPASDAARSATPASGPADGSPAASAVTSDTGTAAASGMASASASPAASAGVSASVATTASATNSLCLQAGPFRSEDMAQVANTLKPVLTTDEWAAQAITVPGIWLVYMGPYPDPELYAKKLSELRRIKGLDFDEVTTPAALASGLSLGRYGSVADAQAGLDKMKLRGIRTARVVVLRAPTEQQLVRVAQAPLKAQVALSAVKLPQGKAFSACRS